MLRILTLLSLYVASTSAAIIVYHPSGISEARAYAAPEEDFTAASRVVYFAAFPATLAQITTIQPLRFFVEVKNFVRGLASSLQNRKQTLFQLFNETLTRKKKAKHPAQAGHQQAHIVVKPFGNISLDFGFTFNLQTSGNVALAYRPS